METPKEEQPTSTEAPKEPQPEGGSYEDSWYQVLKRRAAETPEDDETTED
jgi:hypothetical protein